MKEDVLYNLPVASDYAKQLDCKRKQEYHLELNMTNTKAGK
jgi:hypothetical protein